MHNIMCWAQKPNDNLNVWSYKKETTQTEQPTERTKKKRQYFALQYVCKNDINNRIERPRIGKQGMNVQKSVSGRKTTTGVDGQMQVPDATDQ